ncbi:MAG: DUF3524 domain-containing protein [Gammaproteobacteria bacterium]
MPAMVSERPPALLVSGYDATSHARWAEGVIRAVDTFAWRRVALPARHFSWRVRANALALLEPARIARLTPAPRLLLATSMLDLATLRGCVPALAGTRVVVYFHENQFAYPGRDARLDDVRLISVKSALAADAVAFNSAYNRDTFLDGAAALLARMPDGLPRHHVERIAARAHVLPVPLDLPQACAPRPPRGPLRLLWNHRWEHDKGPARLLALVAALERAGVDFELNVCGQRFRRVPPALSVLQARFAHRLGHCGPLDDAAAYQALLARMDVVLSTALHDFQGLAVLEAVAAGCVPLVPDRLAYRELFAPAWRYPAFGDDVAREVAALAARVTALAAAKRAGRLPVPPALDALGWPALGARYAALLAAPA